MVTDTCVYGAVDDAIQQLIDDAQADALRGQRRLVTVMLAKIGTGCTIEELREWLWEIQRR